MPPRGYYVVFEGREPGIYRDWPSCRAQVDGFPNARHRKLATREEAERAWIEAGGDPVPLPDEPEPIGDPSWRERGIPPGAIAVDAATSGNPGPTEYRGVMIATGELLFHVGPHQGTNNLGEFLAIVHGIAWMQQRGRNDCIYSDSRTAIDWVRRACVRSTLPRDESTAPIWALVDRAQAYLRHRAPGIIELRKWPTRQWGEIPADFGRK